MERRTFLKGLCAMLVAIVAAPAALLRRERTAVPWRWYMENTTWTSEEIALDTVPCGEEEPYSIPRFMNEEITIDPNGPGLFSIPRYINSGGFNPEDRTPESRRN